MAVMIQASMPKAAVIRHISGTCDMLGFSCGTRVGGIKGVAHVFFHSRIYRQCTCHLSTMPACHLVLPLWGAGLLMLHLKEDVAESTTAHHSTVQMLSFGHQGTVWADRAFIDGGNYRNVKTAQMNCLERTSINSILRNCRLLLIVLVLSCGIFIIL